MVQKSCSDPLPVLDPLNSELGADPKSLSDLDRYLEAFALFDVEYEP